MSQALLCTPMNMLPGDHIVFTDHVLEVLTLPRIDVADHKRYFLSALVAQVPANEDEMPSITSVTWPNPEMAYPILRHEMVKDPIK